MNTGLDKYLCDKYPLIFANRNLGPDHSPMHWGITCGDGWYNLLDTMLHRIQSHIDNHAQRNKWNEEWNAKVNNSSIEWNLVVPRQLRPVSDPIEQVVATQVKEKFGGLRFYYLGGDSYIRGVIDMAENMSYSICDVCGAVGTPNKDGWIKVRCPDHKLI